MDDVLQIALERMPVPREVVVPEAESSDAQSASDGKLDEGDVAINPH